VLFIAASINNLYIATKTRAFVASNPSATALITGPTTSTSSPTWKKITLPISSIDHVQAITSHLLVYSGNNVYIVGREESS